jgi:hypothetical protein
MTIVQVHQVMCDGCGARFGHVERFAHRREPGATAAVRKIVHGRGWTTKPGRPQKYPDRNAAKRPTGRDLCPTCTKHEHDDEARLP